jgi:hypothetical protein
MLKKKGAAAAASGTRGSAPSSINGENQREWRALHAAVSRRNASYGVRIIHMYDKPSLFSTTALHIASATHLTFGV